MPKVLLNGNSVYGGTEQDCKDYLIVKARIFAGTDQTMYESLVKEIADNHTIKILNNNYKII